MCAIIQSQAGGAELQNYEFILVHLAGGCQHGVERGGLTQWGRELVQKMEEKVMSGVIGGAGVAV